MRPIPKSKLGAPEEMLAYRHYRRTSVWKYGVDRAAGPSHSTGAGCSAAAAARTIWRVALVTRFRSIPSKPIPIPFPRIGWDGIDKVLSMKRRSGRSDGVAAAGRAWGAIGSRPDLCWPEAASPADDAQLAERITTELRGSSPDVAMCPNPLFAAVPHPWFFAPAMADVAAAAAGRPDFEMIARPRQAPIFTARTPDTFARILPVVIRKGPPEIVLLVLCLEADNASLGGELPAALATGLDVPPGTRFVAAHYDSGDLLKWIDPRPSSGPIADREDPAIRRGASDGNRAA